MQSHRAGHLALTVAAKLREIDEIVKTVRTYSGPAALAMIRSLDEIRSQIDQMVDHERFLRVDHERRAEALEQRKAWLIATAVVIVAVLAGVALALARREASRRRKAIAENVALHSDIQARDRKIRRLVDSNIIGIIIWEVEGRILEANDEFLRMVGYDREDLTAGHLHRTSLTPPEWRDRDAHTVAELRRIGTAQPFEKEYVRKDGSRVPVLIGGAMFEEGTSQGVGFVLDLTERKRAVEALRHSEERFRTLVQFSFDVYWETDAQHRFIHQEFAESLVDAPELGSEIGKTRWDVPYLEPETSPSPLSPPPASFSSLSRPHPTSPPPSSPPLSPRSLPHTPTSPSRLTFLPPVSFFTMLGESPLPPASTRAPTPLPKRAHP